MLAPPLLAFSGIVAELAPPLVALLTRTRDRARIGIAVWCLILLAFDIFGAWLGGVHHANNLFILYITDAVSSVWLFWVLSQWQVRAVPALAVRLLLPCFLLANLILIFAVEDTENFSLVTTTLNGLLVLSLALYTLISRSLDERVRLTRFDWFWVCCGLVVYLTNEMAADPLARVLVKGRMEVLAALLTAKSVVNALAMLIIARGLLCPTQPLRSGGSSLPPSSRPSSSS